jgi:hypothetical protein
MKNIILSHLKLFVFIFLSIIFLVELRTFLAEFSRPKPDHNEAENLFTRPVITSDTISLHADTKAPFVRWMDSLEPGEWFKKVLSLRFVPAVVVAFLFSFILFGVNLMKSKKESKNR